MCLTAAHRCIEWLHACVGVSAQPRCTGQFSGQIWMAATSLRYLLGTGSSVSSFSLSVIFMFWCDAVPVFYTTVLAQLAESCLCACVCVLTRVVKIVTSCNLDTCPDNSVQTFAVDGSLANSFFVAENPPNHNNRLHISLSDSRHYPHTEFPCTFLPSSIPPNDSWASLPMGCLVSK